MSLLKRNGETKQDWDKQKAILDDFEKRLTKHTVNYGNYFLRFV
ncbi:nitrate/nitrite sensor protein NarQ [Actinobacillus equuli]|nr:nitrate/nitrite sensor protein NarQ [Actinobacillus equuli]